MDYLSLPHIDEPPLNSHTSTPSPQPDVAQRSNLRRKYQRQETGLPHEHLGLGDDPGLMSESEEHEMDEISSDIDEETGLTAEERQRHFERKRQNDNLNTRIAGNGSSAQSDSADKMVIRNLLINGALIGLWYVFSLSISIVCTIPPPCTADPDTTLVQQMDVLVRSPRLPLPVIHHIPTHARPVLSSLAAPRFDTIPPASPNAITFRPHETLDHASLLLHTPRTMRRYNIPRYRAGQQFLTLYHTYLLHHVQEFCSRLCTTIRLPLPPRVAEPQAHPHHYSHDHRSNYDGRRRDDI